MSQRILVVGGLGYLGSALVRHLTGKNEVTVVDRMRFPWLRQERLREILDTVRFLQRDANELSARELADFETIIFVAGVSNDPVADYNPFDNAHENTVVPLELCIRAQEAGCRRFVSASSCSVYDGAHNTTQSQPTTALTPRGNYSQSKYALDVLIPSLQTSRFVVKGLRMGTLHGLSDRMRFDLVVNRMVRDVLLGRGLTITGSGNEWRPMLRMSSAITAWGAASVGELDDGPNIVNVADGNVTVMDIAKMVGRAATDLGHPEPNFKHASPPTHRRSYQAALDASPVPSPGTQRAKRAVYESATEMFIELSTWTQEDLTSDLNENLLYIEHHEM